jgi:hypothetical protein
MVLADIVVVLARREDGTGHILKRQMSDIPILGEIEAGQ